MSAAASRASRFGSASAVIADYVGDDGLLSDSAFVTHDPLQTCLPPSPCVGRRLLSTRYRRRLRTRQRMLSGEGNASHPSKREWGIAIADPRR
jgi:hypothetical protein